jgi:hypothetical protein
MGLLSMMSLLGHQAEISIIDASAMGMPTAWIRETRSLRIMAASTGVKLFCGTWF